MVNGRFARLVSFLLTFKNIVSSAASEESFYETQLQARVVGGETAKANEFPWFAVSTVHSLCGGSLIHPRVILTAAHCNETMYEGSFRVNPSSNSFSNTEVRVEIQSYETHPEYAGSGFDYDGRLLLLTAPVTSITPLQVATRNLDDVTGIDYVADTPVTVMGYGQFDVEINKPSTTLRRADTRLVDATRCDELYFGNDINPSLYVCTATAGKGPCRGDSGGPVVYYDPANNNAPIQLGIVSGGVDCGNVDIPELSARVSTFTSWIEDFIERATGDANYLTGGSDVHNDSTSASTGAPTRVPGTKSPSPVPSERVTAEPTKSPVLQTAAPSEAPTLPPTTTASTLSPSTAPPTLQPAKQPSIQPVALPTLQPTLQTTQPSPVLEVITASPVNIIEPVTSQPITTPTSIQPATFAPTSSPPSPQSSFGTVSTSSPVASTSPGDFTLTLIVQFDGFPLETNVHIVNTNVEGEDESTNNATVLSSPQYYKTVFGQWNTTMNNVTYGEYTLIITDSKGDGMKSGSFEGWVEVQQDGMPVIRINGAIIGAQMEVPLPMHHDGDAAEAVEVVLPTLPPSVDVSSNELLPDTPQDSVSVAVTVTYDNFPLETNWTIESVVRGNSEALTVISSGPHNTPEAGRAYTTQLGSLDSGTYRLVLYDSYGDGMMQSTNGSDDNITGVGFVRVTQLLSDQNKNVTVLETPGVFNHRATFDFVVG